MFFLGTLITFLISILNNDIDAIILLGGLCLISLAIHIFSKKQDLLVKFIHNMVLTVLLLLTIFIIANNENQILGFF